MSDQEYKIWKVTEPYVDLHCALGEGPFYEKETNTVRFVDLKKNRLHTVQLDEGPSSLKTVELDVPVTVTSDIEGVDPREKILVGLKYGIAVLDRKTDKYEYVKRFADDGEGDVRLRSNDGAADPHGRFWLGTMNDFYLNDVWPEGFLMRFDAGGRSKEQVLGDLTIPNSVGWSPDGKIMYFTHSTPGTVMAWDYSPEDGSLSNQRVFYQHEGKGGPDGFRVDVEGSVWHAIYGEARVIRISPEGKITGEIQLPTNNITCTEFVGTELFITTAGDDDGDEASKKFAGGLFRVDVGIRGVPPYKYKLATS